MLTRRTLCAVNQGPSSAFHGLTLIRQVRTVAAIKEKPFAKTEDGFRPMMSYRPNSVDLEDELDPQTLARMKRGGMMLGVQNEKLSHRWQRMSPSQDWPSVWPTARSFDHSSVPLPMRMGYQKKAFRDPPPNRYNNLELMKIPNFLHLTPQAIERQCLAIKKFCTPWPSGLDTEEACTEHYPLKTINNTFVHSGPSIRDPRARAVKVCIKLASLPLDKRGRDKFLRLIGHSRYDMDNDMVVIETDRCPTRKQNHEYAMYLLTALFHESKKIEPWEAKHRRVADSDEYIFAETASIQQRAKKLGATLEEGEKESTIREYGEAWEMARNAEHDSKVVLLEYESKAAKLMGMTVFDDGR